MTVRFIVRPQSIRTTPRLLARRLNADTRHIDANVRFDTSRDVFLAYPHPGLLSRYTDPTDTARHREIYSFSAANKAAQRSRLRAAGVRVPETATTTIRGAELERGTFIVRPYRHQGGSHYRITDDPTDFIEGQEYIQRVFPKDREYRVIFSFGEPIILMLKRRPEGASQEEAWNHNQGAHFVTVTKEKNDRLKSTDFYDSLAEVPIIKHGHIIAADVMWSDQEGYSVCELNTCPGLTIPSNLERIANHVEGHR